MQSVEDLRKERLHRFQTAVRYKEKPDRVPNLSYFVTWPFFDAGFSLREAVSDYGKMETAIEKHCTHYAWDGIYCYGTRNPFLVTQKLGAEYYEITEEAINIRSYNLLTCDDLPGLIKDPIKTMWNKCMPRKFPSFKKGISKEVFQDAIDERLRFQAFSAKMAKRGTDEWGYPALTDGSLGFIYFGLEYLFSMTLGIVEFSKIMRRDISLLKEAADALDELWAIPGVTTLEKSTSGNCETSAWDTQICLLAPTVMNTKQYEFLYWPILKRICDACEAKGKTIRIMYEGDTERFIPYYEDYPKGMITFFLEQDDIFALKKRYPNYTWCGGMPLVLLGKGTKEQVVEYARKLVYEVGGDGGFVITQDKMGTSRGDASSENLMAYCDFIASGNY